MESLRAIHGYGSLRMTPSLVDGNDIDLFVDLLDAAVDGNLSRVESLLKVLDVGAASRLDFRRNQPTFGESPLHRASTVEIAKALIEHGVHLDLQGAVGQTPLHTQVNNPAVLQYLLKRGAGVDAMTVDHSTPLHWAVVQDCAESVQILLAAGAKVDHQNDSGNAALHMVCSLEVARILVASGARLDLINKDGQIPLEAAASRPEDDVHLQVATYLLDVSHSASMRASSSFNIFRPEFDGLQSASSEIGPDDEHQIPIDEPNTEGTDGSNGIHNNINNAASTGNNESATGSRMGSISELRRLSTGEEVRSVLKKVDARERWRIVRQRVLKGELRGAAGIGGRVPKRLRFASDVAKFGRAASTASSWSGGDTMPSLLQARTDEFYYRFFEVMVRDRPKLALRMLDRQRTFLFARGNDKIYSYDLLLTGGPVSSNEVLNKMVRDERHELISHEVVQWVFNIRWILFTREALLFEFAVHCIFIGTFLITTLYGEQNLQNCFIEAFHLFTRGPTPERNSHLIQATMELVLCVLNLRYVMRYAVEWHMRERLTEVFSNPSIDVLPYACVMVEQVMRLSVVAKFDDTWVADLTSFVSAIGAVLLWIRLLSFAEGFEIIGVTMCTIRRMLQDIGIYLVVLLIYVTGFSHAIALIFRGSDSSVYGTVYNSWITLYFFVFNLDVGALDEEPTAFRKYMGYLLIGIYMVVVALVILNVIIAIMTNTFDEIQQNAKEQWLLQRARLILTYDIREKSLKKLYRALCFRRGRWLNGTNPVADEAFPELPRKNIVVEKGTGQVEVQVPAEWLHAVNLIRRTSPTYNEFRYKLFRGWKQLRRSPSFLWPELKDTTEFFDRVEADEQRIAQQALNNEAMAISRERSMTGMGVSESEEEDEDSDSEESSSEESGSEDDESNSEEDEEVEAVNSQDDLAFEDDSRHGGSRAPLLRGATSARMYSSGYSSASGSNGNGKSTTRQRGVSTASHSSAASSSEGAHIRRFNSSDNSALRTGVEDELVYIGFYQRNPKRIAADRVMQSAMALQRAIPRPSFVAADLSSAASSARMESEDTTPADIPIEPQSPRSGPASGDVASNPESLTYSMSAPTMGGIVRRRGKSFKRHTTTLEGQIQHEVEDMQDVMALHHTLPTHTSMAEDTMNLRNEAAIEHLTGLVVRLSDQVSALEDKITSMGASKRSPPTLQSPPIFELPPHANEEQDLSNAMVGPPRTNIMSESLQDEDDNQAPPRLNLSSSSLHNMHHE
mmetsp:Transcript_16294/g.31611  ORF Transcript_16294/g.31611 Transcript_16294/m.31611 type:complete len:1246 (+) Transcript_16294:153-3890(+)